MTSGRRRDAVRILRERAEAGAVAAEARRKCCQGLRRFLTNAAPLRSATIPKPAACRRAFPKASTLPYPFEIVNATNKTLILFEMYSLRRQIFTDGRELPKDPKDYAQPSWMGYSVGKWEGDEFVVSTAGVNDQVWNIDLAGHPHSDALRITERFRRVDFGHMDVQVTIDDPKTYTKQWDMPVMRYTLLPDTDLFEFVCEKNIDPQHMVGNK